MNHFTFLYRMDTNKKPHTGIRGEKRQKCLSLQSRQSEDSYHIVYPGLHIAKLQSPVRKQSKNKYDGILLLKAVSTHPLLVRASGRSNSPIRKRQTPFQLKLYRRIPADHERRQSLMLKTKLGSEIIRDCSLGKFRHHH